MSNSRETKKSKFKCTRCDRAVNELTTIKINSEYEICSYCLDSIERFLDDTCLEVMDPYEIDYSINEEY